MPAPAQGFVHHERARFQRALADADDNELRVQALLSIWAARDPGRRADDERWRRERVAEACKQRGLGDWFDAALAEASRSRAPQAAVPSP